MSVVKRDWYKEGCERYLHVGEDNLCSTRVFRCTLFYLNLTSALFDGRYLLLRHCINAQRSAAQVLVPNLGKKIIY